MQVSLVDIESLIKSKMVVALDLDTIRNHTGATLGCGRCTSSIKNHIQAVVRNSDNGKRVEDL